MDSHTFIELHGAEFAYSKLIKRSKMNLLKMMEIIFYNKRKYQNLSINQLADLINFFCCGHIFEKRENYKGIAQMLNCDVDELIDIIIKWKCIDKQILYSLFDFFCPTKENGKHIEFIINYTNCLSNNKQPLLNDKLTENDINYFILKVFVGYARNRFTFYDARLGMNTKCMVLEAKLKYNLIKCAIFKVSINDILVLDIFNIIMNDFFLISS